MMSHGDKLKCLQKNEFHLASHILANFALATPTLTSDGITVAQCMGSKPTKYDWSAD